MNLQTLGEARLLANESAQLDPQGLGEHFGESRQEQAGARVLARQVDSTV